MTWPDDFIGKVICGDCIKVMKPIPDNSGSGSTLIAAKHQNRKFIGIDNNPEYAELSRRLVDSIKPQEALFDN